MDVRVSLHGSLGRLRGSGTGGTLVLSLPEDATAGDLLRVLADRLETPLAATSTPRLPSSVRVFVEGQLVARSDAALISRSDRVPSVTVVLLSPISGG